MRLLDHGADEQAAVGHYRESLPRIPGHSKEGTIGIGDLVILEG